LAGVLSCSPGPYKDQTDFVNQADGNLGYKGYQEREGRWRQSGRPEGILPFQARRGSAARSVDHMNTVMFELLNDLGLQMLWDILDWRQCCDGSTNTILRTLYYPALDFEAERGAVRAAAHEDINFITLLVAASAPGLQVLDTKGQWHDVPHEENSIVVNIGDMLALASKGAYKSTRHRVVNPSDSKSDRISMPLFVHPHPDTLLSDGFTAGEFLAQRIAEIYQQVKS
jgi:isopenicillin N synthase-like dioxygenase